MAENIHERKERETNEKLRKTSEELDDVARRIATETDPSELRQLKSQQQTLRETHLEQTKLLVELEKQRTIAAARACSFCNSYIISAKWTSILIPLHRYTSIFGVCRRWSRGVWRRFVSFCDSVPAVVVFCFGYCCVCLLPIAHHFAARPFAYKPAPHVVSSLV